MRLLFIGLGSVGRRHLDNAHGLGLRDLHVWRSGEGPPGRSLPSKVQEHPSLEAALASRPHAVFISNPTSLHVATALTAAKAGCHLFIEKPLSHSMDGVSRLVSVVKEKQLTTLMGFTLRFHPGLRRIKRLLDEGHIGTVVGIRAQVGQYLPDWRPSQNYRKSYSARQELGGGVILDLIHEIDYACWFGGMVVSVACLAGRLSGLEIDTEDNAEILLRFSDGTIGSVHMDYVQRRPTRTCHLIGTEGSIIWDAGALEVRVSRYDRDWEVFHDEGFERNDMFLAQMRHFLDCVDGKAQSVADVECGARLQEIAMAAHESNEKGRVCSV